MPNEKAKTVKGGRHEYEREWEELNTPPFTTESMVNEVFANPKAQKAFNEVFGEIFRENGELDWMRRFATLRFMAEFREGDGKLKVSDFPEMLDRANRLFLMS